MPRMLNRRVPPSRRFETVEDLGAHLRSTHHRTTDYAAMACDEWARGSDLCPFCDLYGTEA